MNQLLMQVAPFGEFHGTSVGAALGNMALFAIFAIVLLFVSVKIFDKALTRIDLEGEIAKGNIAAAILTGAVIIGISIIIAVSMT